MREAAIALLYRLLFILYAEDRGLLPVQNLRYDDYSLRKRRDDVKRRKDAKDVFSTRFCRYWGDLQDLCQAIDRGDASIGLPPYNGGLFNAAQTPLLTAVNLNDQVLADVPAALSFDSKTGSYINYRDLSVEQLGSIYERPPSPWPLFFRLFMPCSGWIPLTRATRRPEIVSSSAWMAIPLPWQRGKQRWRMSVWQRYWSVPGP